MELECKIAVSALAPLADRLRDLGATFVRAARERNVVLDSADGRLAAEGRLLRIRARAGEAGGLLTVKSPLAGGAFKAREELETRVDDPELLARQLGILGFGDAVVYEKDRAEWNWRGGHVALDSCPEIGCFVEVEGTEEVIRLVLADLGIDPAGHTPNNYLALWREHLRARGEAGWRDMVFVE